MRTPPDPAVSFYSSPIATLAYRFRPGRGSPIVILHGLGGSGIEEYAPLFLDEQLADHALLTLDLLGFGHSDKPVEFSYSLEAQGDVIAGLLTSLGLSPAILVGHSLGGAMALLFAQRQPSLTKALIMAEGGLETKYLTLSRWAVRHTEESFAKEFSDLLGGEGGMLGSFSVLPTLRMTHSIAFYRSSVSLIEHAKDRALLYKFYESKLPKEYWVGEKSLARWGDAFCKELDAQKIPWQVIVGAGHQLVLDQPKALAKALSSFLARLP